MSHITTSQEFLAAATQKAGTDLLAALDSLPEGKRTWQPAPAARSAMDQVAECAILSGVVADTVTTRTGPDAGFMQSFFGEKALLAQEEANARALLQTNVARVVAAIQALPDADLETEVNMPWGGMTLRALCTYPFWNMSYHQGQITYIGSLIGE